MKSKTMYQCETCNFTSENKSEAESCESRHLKITKIVPFYVHNEPSPISISVLLEDGTSKYFREKST